MGSSTRYMPGVIIEIGRLGYRVHFDGYTASYDDWVKADHIRRAAPAPAPTAPGPTASVTAQPAGNGKPPCQIGTVTRAGALNYDARIIAIDPVKSQYKVQFVTGYKGDVEYLYPRDLKTCYAPDPPPVQESWFYGVWQLSTGGGGAWAKNPVTGSWHVTALDVAGAPPIRINSDGTFEWILDSTKVARGRWHRAAPSELKSGYEKRGTAILLVNGEDGKDWLVTRELVGGSDSRERILLERKDLGLTYWGRRLSTTGK